MELDMIKKRFRTRNKQFIGFNRCHSVLVPIIEINQELHLLYQVRAKSLKRQPGEISFPGGHIEEGESPKEAVIRETVEELGIQREKVEIIGELDYFLDYRGEMIYPFLGHIKESDINKIHYSKAEVEEIFTVPINFLLNQQPKEFELSYKVDPKADFPFQKIPNQGFYYFNNNITLPMFFYEYASYTIWGLTAKITRNFIEELPKGL